MLIYNLTALSESANLSVLPAEELPLRTGGRLPVGAVSAIVGIFPYFAGYPEGRNVALYAIGRDYHRVLESMLDRLAASLSERFPGEKFWARVDSSPIDEKAAAERAGLGEIGRNGLLLTPRWGQFVFIGCLLTTLSHQTLGISAREPPNLCTQCGRCVAACPTGALSDSGFNRSLCRSNITQKKGELSDWERLQIAAGGLVWGCDACQTACPHNLSPETTPIAELKAELMPIIDEHSVKNISDRAYLWRGRRVLLRNLEIVSSLVESAGTPQI